MRRGSLTEEEVAATWKGVEGHVYTCGAVAVATLAAVLLGAGACCAVAVATLSSVLGHCCELVPRSVGKDCVEQRNSLQAAQKHTQRDREPFVRSN